MKMPRRKKTRLKMGLMIGISALSIGALAASTMAWYSVTASITVNSSTISIRTALQYHFYAYNGNGFTYQYDETNPIYLPGSGYSGTPASGELNPADNAVTTKYTEVNELADYDHREAIKTALTTVSGMWPGYKMSFAIRVDGLQYTDSSNRDEPQLKLISANIEKGIANGASYGYISGTANKPLRRIGAADATNYITMANAMKISAGSGSTLANAVSSSTAAYSANVNYQNYTGDTITSNWYGADRILGTAYPTSNNSSWWYFFTVEFSNDNTTYYTYNNAGYYSASTSGNSSCYEGLPFGLGTMDLK